MFTFLHWHLMNGKIKWVSLTAHGMLQTKLGYDWFLVRACVIFAKSVWATTNTRWCGSACHWFISYTGRSTYILSCIGSLSHCGCGAPCPPHGTSRISHGWPSGPPPHGAAPWPRDNISILGITLLPWFTFFNSGRPGCVRTTICEGRWRGLSLRLGTPCPNKAWGTTTCLCEPRWSPGPRFRWLSPSKLASKEVLLFLVL